MLIHTIKIKKSTVFIVCFLIMIILLSFLFYDYYSFASRYEYPKENSTEESQDKKYIKWIDFKVTYPALEQTAKLDIESHRNNQSVQYNWVELLSYLACKYAGDFNKFKSKDLTTLVKKLESGTSMQELAKDMKYYPYYYESYSAILSEFIGEYEIETVQEDDSTIYEKKYGIKAFLPIAKNYGFSHYDDFGNARSYGFKRVHLGNDLMGSIGTPIIAVESGVVEACGWNQYGGWRIGIRSFDGRRYYYYAHLRKNHPYAKDLTEGSTVTAGDVIGYLGMTGYSTKENVNNINVPHLHFGMQLIFDESQKEGNNEIWIDVYSIIEFLKKNRSEVFMKYKDSKDYERKYQINISYSGTDPKSENVSHLGPVPDMIR